MVDEDILNDEVQAIPSGYEIERNKPMPNRIHGKIQLNLGFELKLNYEKKFDFSTEVTLDSTPASTPDILIFAKRKEALDWQKTTAKETEIPLTTIEIVSPSQSMDEMAKKVWEVYFPLGIKSSWIVMPPPFKAVYILTPDGKKEFFDKGKLKDPTNNIQIEINKIFEGLK